MNCKNILTIKIINTSALIFFASFVFCFFLMPAFAVGIPATPTLEVIQFDAATSISSFVKYIIGWAFKLAGVLAFVMIVYAGFQYLTSGGNTTQQKDAQERIVSAIIGIVLLFAFYIILNTINPDILKETAAPTPPVVTPPVVTPPDQEPSEILVNIIDMGIPVAINTLGSTEAYLDKTLADILLTLKDEEPPWVVTDACIDPECHSTSINRDDHPDSCHLDGTCVDIDITSGNHNDLINILNDAGLNVLDEVDHLHVALQGAEGWGSYPGSDGQVTQGYWYGAN